MAGGSHQGAAIKPIDKAAVHRICSGQVVLDLATAVKELVENSLDAGARNIDIRLKEYGSELIEVADNGCGVAPENHAGLALKYHTSKISTFTDLTSLATFGFRGEALSSLCALADVSITTRTAAEPVATELVFDRNGRVASSRKVARAVGTTVAVGKLFSPLPVRYREFTRNVKREYGKLLTLLQAYALISTDVRLICTNQAGSTGRSTVIQTQGGRSVRDNIVTVFGTKFAASLEPIEVAIGDSLKVTGFVSKAGAGRGRASGDRQFLFVSKAGAGCGRASGDRQFLFVNGRPVEMPKVGKLLNETYRAFNSLQYPMAVLNFVLPTDSYDVNVTPDKRKIFLHTEADLLSALRTSLEQLYAPDKYVFRVQESQPAERKGGAKQGKKRSLSVGGDEEESAESSESDGDEEERGGEMSENESEEEMGGKGEKGRGGTGFARRRKSGMSAGLEEEGGEEEGGFANAGNRSFRESRASAELEEYGSGREGRKGKKRSLEGGEANGGEPSQGASKRRASSPEVEIGRGDETNGGETTKKRSLADTLEEEEGEEGDGRAGSSAEIEGGNGTRGRRNKDRTTADEEEGGGAEAPSGADTRKGGQASEQSEPPGNDSEDEQEDTPPERTEPERGARSRSAHFGRVRSAGRTPVPLNAFLNVPATGKADVTKAAHVPGGTPRAEIAPPGKKPRQASLSGFLVRGKPSAGPPDVRRAADTCPDLRESEESDGLGSADERPDDSARNERHGETESASVRDRGGRSGGAKTGNVEPPAGGDLPTETVPPGERETEVLEEETEDEIQDDAGPSGRDSLGSNGARIPGSKASADQRTPFSDVRTRLPGVRTALPNGRASLPDGRTSLPDASPLPVDASNPSPDVRTNSPGGPPSDDMRVAFDVGRVRQRWANWRAEQLDMGRETKRGRQFAAASLGRDEAGDLDAATNELERVFNKKDFGKMAVCGQFNLGFIIARLDNDLFIVDQHASDEKYNFERLVRTTVLNKQPLLNPLGLDLTAAEEVTCQEHLQAFRRNGFELVEARDAPAGRRFKLAAVPFSKNITFGPDDVHELVSLLADAPVEAADSPGGSSPVNAVRPKRVRTMLALRACRSSIMIGDPLNKQQMVKILHHLEGLDAPWNCPHGRPTMRHLVDLATLKL